MRGFSPLLNGPGLQELFVIPPVGPGGITVGLTHSKILMQLVDKCAGFLEEQAWMEILALPLTGKQMVNLTSLRLSPLFSKTGIIIPQ